MANSNNLKDLFADDELPFGHPGRNFDDTPVFFDDFDDRYEPPLLPGRITTCITSAFA